MARNAILQVSENRKAADRASASWTARSQLDKRLTDSFQPWEPDEKDRSEAVPGLADCRPASVPPTRIGDRPGDRTDPQSRHVVRRSPHLAGLVLAVGVDAQLSVWQEMISGGDFDAVSSRARAKSPLEPVPVSVRFPCKNRNDNC